MKTGIVIVSWNKPDILSRCVNSILKHKPDDCGIIIVDNGSDDTGFLKDYSDAEVILNKENIGCPAALNQGFRKAIENGAEYIFRADNDIEVTEGAIQELVKVANERDAITAPFTNSGSPHQTRQECTTDHYSPGTVIAVPSVTGFFVCYPKDIWLDTGEFPCKTDKGEVLLRYAEDTMHCLIAVEKGHRIYACPHAWVLHEHGASRDMGDFVTDRKRAAEYFNRWRKV